MANISKLSVANRAIVWFFLALILLGGAYSFDSLGKKEDSTFKIKSAVVICPYKGATPDQVEALVVEPLERELRTLREVRKITSEAHFGYARLVVELQPSTPAERVEQLWDELRRKVDNAATKLPEGAGPISVADDFGDVYGIYYAIAADEGYTWEELRSMAQQLECDEKKGWTVKNDPRVTKVGKILRKTSLDELPQLFNILKGDMSLVGPRPERPQFVEKFKEEIPRYMVKHQVRPGLTGWAQINGYRGDTSIKRRVEYDLYYIENWTLWMDIKIIFLTFFTGFINKNAY